MASKKTIGNFVAIDEIYKDHVRKEKHAQKNWEKNHGYIVEEIKNMEAKTNEQCEKISHGQTDWKESLPVTVGESPSFPRTSTGMIGWRSTKPDLNLETYGDGGCRRGDIIRTFKWPREGIL